ncbi:isopentenyl phosphate kinase family protein, partial [Patescibacteria group bacterium]|nr:isopentenyl phosphate kinase family protein [Patescibacteria group bacterium]
MKKLILIKLGGSVITDKSKAYCAKEKVITRLGKEIFEAQKKYEGKLIIGHGQGSFAHIPASKYQTHLGLINKESVKGAVVTSNMAIEPNRIVMSSFIKVGLLVKTFSPASFILAKDKKLQKLFLEPILNALQTGLIPVMYGDVIEDVKKGFCIFSTDKIFRMLINSLSRDYKIEKIIFCSDTDGVYDSNGKTIARITPSWFKKNIGMIGGSKSTDVTGGMLHKVEECLKMAEKYGVQSLIINGNVDGNLKKAILG